MQPLPPPPVPSPVPGGPAPGGDVRPGRFWYALAVAILLVAIAVPVAVYVAGRLATPQIRELGIGVTRADLDPAHDLALYVSKPRTLAPPPCVLTGPGDVVIAPYRPITQVVQDDTNWYAVLRVHATAKGTYTMTCLGPPGGLRLGVGDVPAARPGVLAALAINALVPLAGVLGAGAVVLVVALRRKASRDALAAGAAGYPPPAPYGGYSGPAYDPPPAGPPVPPGPPW